MYFMDAIRVLIRRWYVVVAGLLVMCVAAGAAILLVPTNYQASGEMLFLLPAAASGKTTPTNPYLNVQPGLTLAATLVAGTLSTKDTARDMVAHGYRAKYSVSVVPGTGPLIGITTEDTDPAAALATRNELTRRIEAELLRLQNNESVPLQQVMVARPYSVTSQAEVLSGSKIRVLAVIAALGIILTTIIAFGVDRSRLQTSRSVARTQGIDDRVDDGSPPVPAEAEADTPDTSQAPAASSGTRGAAGGRRGLIGVPAPTPHRPT
jgi:capsular polysaccharide biosynthesis protein